MAVVAAQPVCSPCRRTDWIEGRLPLPLHGQGVWQHLACTLIKLRVTVIKNNMDETLTAPGPLSVKSVNKKAKSTVCPILSLCEKSRSQYRQIRWPSPLCTSAETPFQPNPQEAELEAPETPRKQQRLGLSWSHSKATLIQKTDTHLWWAFLKLWTQDGKKKILLALPFGLLEELPLLHIAVHSPGFFSVTKSQDTSWGCF